MESCLKEHLGKVVKIFLKSNKEFEALIVKVNDGVVKININKKWGFISIDEIYMFGQSIDTLEKHVIPNAFT